ncbi:hypothetical protein [Chryseobacterium sp.]|uniref:hypothetical protein n=1 Tax=Chryseobacterium sp. TaxID=1871047 RepID=UPI003340CC17
MKNKLYSILLLASSQLFFGQLSTIKDNFLSAPSVSSLPSYVQSPVSPSSGIPDVSIPFFSLPTHNSSVAVNCGMSYHPNNSGRYNKASDVGNGWSVFGLTALIYQNINPYTGFPEGDTFYYSIPGRSGKFSAKKDPSGVAQITKISYDKLNINATVANGEFNFTITDEMGNTYYFNTLDISYVYQNGLPKNFTTCYYLSKVVDVNGLELLKFEYQEDNYTISPPALPGVQKPVKGLKIKKVTSADFGEISLNYAFDPVQRSSYNDPFQLESIEMKTTAGKTVKKIGFQYSIGDFTFPYGYMPVPPNPCGYTEVQTKRILNKVLEYDNNGLNPLSTEFTYNYNNFDLSVWVDAVNPAMPCFANEDKNPKYLGKGLLTAIKFPTGSTVKYEYEPNQYWVNKNTAEYLEKYAPAHSVQDREAQYYEDVITTDFDTNVSTTKFFSLPANPDNAEGTSSLEYWIDVEQYYDNPILEPGQPPFVNVSLSGATTTPEGQQKYFPGFKSLTFTGTGGRGKAYVKRVRYKSLPLPNYSTGKGVRIKKIEYYDGANLIPALTRSYFYQNFSNNNESSGFLNEYEEMGIVYKNVKETIGENKGYTQYYFKALDDYPENLKADGKMRTDTLHYYNLLMNGIADKTEIYNNVNTLVSSESNSYEFYQTATNKALKMAMIQKQTITATNYTGSGAVTVNTEITRSPRDFNIINSKTTGADGTVSEVNTTYPWGIFFTDPRLWNAGLKAVPLVVENKRNGKTISKSEVKYSNLSHYNPTSVISTNPNDGSLKTSIRYDAYDAKGNVTQYTTVSDEASGAGIPTTMIWGYNAAYPIASIEGATLNDIGSLAGDIITKSNQDTDNASEKVLLQALDAFRTHASLKNFHITTYTYNPLVGITSSTPPTGIREMYQYDRRNRLQYIIDVNGNMIKDYRYNIKPQP